MDINRTIQSALRHYQSGDSQQSKQLCKKILKEHPDNAEALYFLGVIYFQSANYDLAIKYIEKSLEFYPANADACHILGMAFQEKGQLDNAITFYQKAISLNPKYAEALNNLGNALKEKGLLDEAISNYRRALYFNSDLATAYRNIGVCLMEKKMVGEAVVYYQKAINSDPSYAATYNLLGIALKEQDKLDDALRAYNDALRLNPDFAEPYSNIGSIFQIRGNLDEAEVYYRRALRIKPNAVVPYQNLLFAMLYNSHHDAQSIFFEHLKFAKQFAETLSSSVEPHTNETSPAGRLRIGYVSPDFKKHSVASFIEPALANHNRELFNVFCYSTVPYQDEVTQRLRKYADYWRDIAGMSDDDAAELIRKDGINILIDLAGHTAHNRILLFARKPAPVQVGWIGYPATTGLSTMDYKIVDGYTDPPGMTEQFYTEKLIRMPESFLCYMPVSDSPDIGTLPALVSGHITFGSFNSFVKVSHEVIELWVKILNTVPGSRLIMKAKSLSDGATRDYLMEVFTRKNIKADRIELLSWEPSVRRHLDIYNRIDIGLDTFPYNGTTVTGEAMWMGVPVITLAGNSHASRVGASLLSNVGIPELIAETCDEYVEIAVNLAADIKRLKTLHESLRGMVASSPLTDAKKFIVNLENSYRAMWEKRCME